MRASERSRTACLHLTRALLCQVSYRGMAAGQRLELRFAAPEATVLPLDDPALSAQGGSRTRSQLVLSELGQPVAITRARCAARESNPAHRGKSSVHLPQCLQRMRAAPGNRTPLF